MREMADKRMFAKSVIESDTFLDLPLTSQALYFHFCMAADDEGFTNNVKRIQRMIGATESDLDALVAKNFVIRFDSGVIVITHWKVNNWIRNDRLKNTAFASERSKLFVLESGEYTLDGNALKCRKLEDLKSSDRQMTDTCQTSVRQTSDIRQTNDSIEEKSIDKNSIDKNREEESVSHCSNIHSVKDIKEGLTDGCGNVDIYLDCKKVIPIRREGCI